MVYSVDEKTLCLPLWLPNNAGKMLGFGAHGQEGILKMSLVQKVVSLKHRDRTRGQKELNWDCEE